MTCVRRGADVLVDVLRREGVRHVFGNPGTTELPLVEAVAAADDLVYVLALQENSAVAMADGFAQASHRPAFVNLHTAAGLGGGIGNLTNADAGRVPLVVTVGQQDRRHLADDPLLAADLVGLATGASKDQIAVERTDDLGCLLQRAFRCAASPPRGPVVVSIPMDVLWEPTGAVVGSSTLAAGAVADGLDHLAALLASTDPGALAVVLGDEVAARGAVPAAQRLAEALGCPVWGAPLYGRSVFPTAHDLWQGALPATNAGIASRLGSAARVLVIGAPAFRVLHYSEGPPLPPSVELLHLDAEPARVGRNHPTRLGCIGDVGRSLEVLAGEVEVAVDPARARAAREAVATSTRERRDRLEAVALQRCDRRPLHPMAAAHTLLRALPDESIVVDEAITAGAYVRGFHRTSTPDTYFCASQGGGLGWGIPASLGIALARPEAVVCCVVGDGAAMYSVQALWSAARYDIPVLVVVLSNGEYRVLREGFSSLPDLGDGAGTEFATRLDQPEIDFVGLARALGVDAQRVTSPDDLVHWTRAAVDARRPGLAQVDVASG